MFDRPLIITAQIQNDAQFFLNAKREQHFPLERNYLEAHLTLFHKLPGEKLNEIEKILTQYTNQIAPISARAEDIMFMGFGSAFKIDCPQLISIRENLAREWVDVMTPQDSQKFRPHITFQNKVEPNEAKQVYQHEKEIFMPFDFTITGLQIWYYDGGPWEHIMNIPFES